MLLGIVVGEIKCLISLGSLRFRILGSLSGELRVILVARLYVMLAALKSTVSVFVGLVFWVYL